MQFLAPFSIRHSKILDQDTLEQLKSALDKTKGKNILVEFTRNFPTLLEKKEKDKDFTNLALDIFFSIEDYEKILEYSSPLYAAEYYFYRALAFYKLNQFNKVASLKLQFEMKFERAFDLPRNRLILAFLDLFITLKENPEEVDLKLEEIGAFLDSQDEEFKSKFWVIIVYSYYSELLFIRDHLNKTEEIARLILSYSLQNQDPYLQSNALILLSSIYIRKGEFRKAKQMIKSSLVPVNQTGELTNKAKILNNLLLLDLAKMDYLKAVERISKMRELKISDKKRKELEILELKLKIHLNPENNIEEKINEITSDLEKEDKFYQDILLLQCWYNIKKKNYDKAKKGLEEHLKLTENNLNSLLENRYYHGLYHKEVEDYEKAFSDFEEVIELSEKDYKIELLVKSLMHFLDLAFSKNNEKYSLSEIIQKINILEETSTKQFIPKLQVDTLMIKMIFTLLNSTETDIMEDWENAMKKVHQFRYIDRVKQLNIIRSCSENNSENNKMDQLEELFKEIIQPYECFFFIKKPKKKEE